MAPTSCTKRPVASFSCLADILDQLKPDTIKDSYMLWADAIKVTAGLNKNGGDVDMFRFEDGVPLNQYVVGLCS